MKKTAFILIFLILVWGAWGQTWTETTADENWDIEYTIIQQEQFTRIMKANEATAYAVYLNYQDTVELNEGKVIQGSRPEFNGYYYILARRTPRSEQANVVNGFIKSQIIYGNSKTGAMTITFLTVDIFPGAINLGINYNIFVDKYNQLIGLVNGE